MFSDMTVGATLSHWVPKCNQEMELRLRLTFEVPLDESVIHGLPEPLQRLAGAVSKLDDGLTEGAFSTEYTQSLDVLEVPDTDSVLRLDNVQLTSTHIYRPLPKDGPSGDLFLTFSTTVRAEGEFGDRLVTWALRHLRRTVFLKAYEVQGRLPLGEPAMSAA